MGKRKWLLLCGYVFVGGVVMTFSQSAPEQKRDDVFAPAGILAEYSGVGQPAPMSTELEVKQWHSD